MTAIAPQTFSEDLILPRLVAYFNSLPEADRTISTTDLRVYKIVAVADGDGNPIVHLGDKSTVTSDNYLGEASFIWGGLRNTPVVATATDFVEISKYIKPETPALVIPYTLPSFFYTDRTISFTLDASKSTGAELYGMFYVIEPILIDSDSYGMALMNTTTAINAADPTSGDIRLILRPDMSNNGAELSFYLNAVDVASNRMAGSQMGTYDTGGRTVQASGGTVYAFYLERPLPTGFYAEVQITLNYKQILDTTSKISIA